MTSTSRSALDPSIRVFDSADGSVSYILPPRQLGKLRWLGLIALAVMVGALAVVIDLGWFFASMLSTMFHRNIPGFAAALAALGFFVLLINTGKKGRLACKLILLGIGLLFGSSYSEIRVDPEFVRDIEHAGPFALTVLRRKRAEIQSFRIANAGIDSTAGNPNLNSRFYSIQVLPTPDLRQKDFAPAYPRELLISLAQALAAQLAIQPPEDILRTSSAPVTAPTVEIDPLPKPASPNAVVESEPAIPQPAGSKAILLQDGATTTIVLPPTGFTGGARAFLLFAIAWCSFIGFFTTMALLTSSRDFRRISMIAFPAFIILLFWAIGIGMLLTAIQTARRKAVLIATPDLFVFTQSGPLAKSERQIPRSSIAAIRRDNSGTTINNRPLLQLQVHLTDATRAGFLTGRDDAELEWLAFVLRNALQVPSHAALR